MAIGGYAGIPRIPRGRYVMDLKLRRMVYSVSFWLSIFAAFVIFHSAWALTH